MKTIWLDTDIGHDVDDAVALLCALRHPQIQLAGISTVTGRVEINTWLAQEMLRRAGRADLTVFTGCVAPLSGKDVADDWLPSHARLAPELPRARAEDDEARIEAIADAILALPEPVHLVTIGPLTNIGRLLQQRPSVAGQWLSTTCMAGLMDSDKPEYNVMADPEAARLAFSHLTPHLVGLEASSYTLPRAEVDAALDPADPASSFLLDCYREYRSQAGWHKESDTAPLTLFDPIALLSLLSPDLYNFQSVRAFIERDGRLRLTDDGVPMTYAFSADWPAIKSLLVGLLKTD